MNNIKSNYILGTWSLSGDYGKIRTKNVFKILEYAYKKKFIEFDTSPSYGNGKMEFILGEVFKDKQVLINTKIGNHPFFGKNFNLDNLENSFYESLKRLSRDSINILYLHNPRIQQNNLEKCLKFMKNLKKNKLINKTGISLARNFTYNKNFLQKFDIIQDEYNLLNINSDKYLKKIKTNFYARSVFANGILTNHFNVNKIYTAQDHRSRWLNEKKRKETIQKCINELQLITNKDIQSLAINFILNEQNISKTIFGIKKKEHIEFLEKNIKRKMMMNHNNQIKKLINLRFNLKKNELKFTY